MPDRVEFGIRIRADTARAQRGIRELRRSVDGLRGSLRHIGHYALGGILGFQAALKLNDITRFLVNTASEFETLGATLEMVTSSAARAQLEFGRLRAFAASTPYDIQQVVDAFINFIRWRRWGYRQQCRWTG